MNQEPPENRNESEPEINTVDEGPVDSGQVTLDAGSSANQQGGESVDNMSLNELDETVYGTPEKKSDESNGKIYKCEYCEFTTSRAGALGSHRRIHTRV
jgi:hypothetical protein